MKLFIACPSHSGLVTCSFMSSYINTMVWLQSSGIEHLIKFHIGESAIGRGRNHMALDFLESDCDKLLFLDTDLVWTPQDIKRLLDSGKPLIGGTYPLKAFPITLNFNPLSEQRPQLYEGSDFLTNYKAWVSHRADELGLIEVMHVPTGMMLIDRSVFEILAKTTEVYYSLDSVKKQTRKFFDFFQFKTIDSEYMSEDWYFCHTARKAGIKVYMHPESIAAHTGTHHFGIGQHVAIGQTPLIRD